MSRVWTNEVIWLFWGQICLPLKQALFQGCWCMSKFASNQKQKLKHQNKLSLSQIRKALCWYLWLFFRFISENLGGYIGASLGGFTFDKIGFVNGTTVVIGMQVRALSREITFLSGTFIALIGFRYQHHPLVIHYPNKFIYRDPSVGLSADIQNWKCLSRVSFLEQFVPYFSLSLCLPFRWCGNWTRIRNRLGLPQGPVSS